MLTMSFLLLCCSLLLSTVFFFLYLRRCFPDLFGHGHDNITSKLPPGTSGRFPLLGDTLSFVAPHISFSKGRFLEENIKRYGKIFRSHIFGYPTIVSCDAEFNNFVLQNEDRLVEAGYPKTVRGILGDLNLIVVTGEEHRRLRGVVLTFFASMRAHDSSIVSDIEEVVLRLMDSWKNKDTLVFCAETRKFTFGVVVRQILSLSPEDPETKQIMESFSMFMRGLSSIPVNLPGMNYAKAIQGKFQIQETVRTILRRRKEGADQRLVQGRRDFLDVLMSQDGVSEAEILSLVLDLLLGGYETTAMLIAIVAKFLSCNKEMLDELRAEHVASMQRKKDGERLGWDDYRNMQFTQSLINEGLRMGSIVKGVHRITIKPIQYKGYEIPVGWKILPIFTGVHLDSSLHDDPFDFNPRRWQEWGNSMKNFIPFGGGKRLCPGADLARVEACVFLHHLALNFSWTPLRDDEWPMHLPWLDFKHGLPLSIKPTPNYASPPPPPPPTTTA